MLSDLYWIVNTQKSSFPDVDIEAAETRKQLTGQTELELYDASASQRKDTELGTGLGRQQSIDTTLSTQSEIDQLTGKNSSTSSAVNILSMGTLFVMSKCVRINILLLE